MPLIHVPLAGTPTSSAGASPLTDRGDHRSPSVFLPESALREARRQKGLLLGKVPKICLLDPDGDIVDFVRRTRGASMSPHWACFHTRLWELQTDNGAVGIVGSAVGGPFAVLVAEQLFASGCEFLISVSSAGQIAADCEAPSFVLIETALRDEGTSHHYLPPAPFVAADSLLVDMAAAALARSSPCRIVRGASWTTDAPFRETAQTIALRRAQRIQTVEMEAASLLAFAEARGKPVLCLAQVTNQLGCLDGDFDKGELQGAALSLRLVLAVAMSWSTGEASFAAAALSAGPATAAAAVATG